MKPISVKFKCFGPYMEEQFIDFRELEKSGLFLICGETGSGKTTILDAICCALYGQSSGGGRGGLLEMRCKRGTQTDTTSVEYIFSSGENTYRFYRAIKPKKQQQKSLEAGKPQSFNDECECQILREGQFVPMADTKATQKYVNARAEEILGLKYDQFRQVVILPQGQFEKLLTSDSADKEKILETLFHAQRWSEITALLFAKVSDEKKQLELKQTELEAQMKRFGCDTLDALQALTVQTERDAKTLKDEVEKLGETVDKYREAHKQAEKDDEKFQALDKAQDTLTGLKNKQATMETKRIKLSHAKKAETITPRYTAWQQAKSAADTAADNQAKLEGEQQKADTAYQNILTEQTEHEKQREAYEEQKEQRIVLENKKDLYRSLSDKKQAQTDADAAEENADKAFTKAKESFGRMERKLNKAGDAEKQAGDAYRAGNDAYFRGIKGEMAQQLVEGEACPVCGSIHHPAPAPMTPDHISAKELEELKEAYQRAMDAVTAATTSYNTAKDEKQKAELFLKECSGAAKSAREIYAEALSQRVAGIDTELQRTRAVAKLQAEIEAFEKADSTMTQRIKEADTAAQTAKKLAEAAKKTADEKATAAEEARRAWTAAYQAHFPTETAYLAACMEADARDALQREIIQYDTDLSNAKSAVEDQQAALGDAVRPDVKGAKQRLDDAEAEKAEKNNAQILKNQEAVDQRKTLQKLEKKLPILAQNQQRSWENEEFAKRLRGDSGISLQRYVLGVMLTAITAQANRLLKNVYGGRYQLYRTDEASGKSHKKGLELVVVDRDGSRAVTSLSGGEKFLLSLSLAIGLAGVVQAQGKGVHLEAMFIDEGFGSLDGSCIDDAMEILESVRRSSGIVGIISHVDRLAETIPAKIEITKTGHGSTCKVTC